MNPPNNIQEFVALKVIEHLEKENEEKKKTEQFLSDLRDFVRKRNAGIRIDKCGSCSKHLYYYASRESENSGCFSCDACRKLFCKECVESNKIEYKFVTYDIDCYKENCKFHYFWRSNIFNDNDN